MPLSWKSARQNAMRKVEGYAQGLAEDPRLSPELRKFRLQKFFKENDACKALSTFPGKKVGNAWKKFLAMGMDWKRGQKTSVQIYHAKVTPKQIKKSNAKRTPKQIKKSNAKRTPKQIKKSNAKTNPRGTADCVYLIDQGLLCSTMTPTKLKALKDAYKSGALSLQRKYKSEDTFLRWIDYFRMRFMQRQTTQMSLPELEDRIARDPTHTPLHQHKKSCAKVLGDCSQPTKEWMKRHLLTIPGKGRGVLMIAGKAGVLLGGEVVCFHKAFDAEGNIKPGVPYCLSNVRMKKFLVEACQRFARIYIGDLFNEQSIDLKLNSNMAVPLSAINALSPKLFSTIMVKWSEAAAALNADVLAVMADCLPVATGSRVDFVERGAWKPLSRRIPGANTAVVRITHFCALHWCNKLVKVGKSRERVAAELLATYC